MTPSSLALPSCALPAHVPLVALTRGGPEGAPSIESIHYGSVLALGADGEPAYQAGDPDAPVFARSALKLLFAVGMLRAGLEITDSELAVACASHSAQDVHLATVLSLLERHGLSEADLANTPGVPLGRAERRAFTRAGLTPDSIHQNCSGKHAAMLATCVQRGWDTATYLDHDHPLQRQLRATVADLAGVPVPEERVTRDGCGAEVYPLPLAALATAFARLVAPYADEACRAVVRGMSSHPVLAGGEDRDPTAVMRALPGAIAKDGAEGFFVVGLPGRGAAVVTIADGAMRACLPALVPALAALGVAEAELEPLAAQPVLGWGQPVGGVVRLR